ncbi:hypothetical protein BABINDRAFT_161223 [Babjeviella inositovora NRRL Y-12698]|uniref:Protein PBN1 n=1 Tax=Babjeviella inositovora NRRL Y-12698 TaxID=984486 RepID=A0A1E3QRD9_9ASCO|nr:uncharacterized protein BABINDRAFT_161223 [Babjeviella inositovora NRRL Y-12698]ODQ80259.1 hypothetical protein BABINDRAFT_161223 [Babjeviella inositovora NRRL Y-12698]
MTSHINHRVTFIHPADDNFVDIDIDTSGILTLPVANFPRQDRYRVPQALVPVSIKNYLQGISQLRIQWASYTVYPANRLFLEVVQPGLHVHFTPGTASEADAYRNVASLLEQFFELKAEQHNFTLSTSATLFVPLKTIPDSFILNVALLLQHRHGELGYLKYADTLTLAYSAQKQEMVLQTYFSSSAVVNVASKQDTTVFKPRDHVRTEIGIFGIDENASSLDDFTLNGVRYAVAPDSQVERTFLHVKPRHRTVPFAYSSQLSLGLHPKTTITFNDTLVSPEYVYQFIDTSSIPADILAEQNLPLTEKKCALFLHYTIPKAYFFDKYQLPKGADLVGYWGETDLEAPEYAVDGWGSELLLELDQELASRRLELTLHSRYQTPVNTDTQAGPDQVQKEIPYPHVFYACDPDVAPLRDPESRLLGVSPFDSKGLGYESYFTGNTVFYHLTASTAYLAHTGTIPTAVGSYSEINAMTSAIVGLGFLFLLWKFVSIGVGKKLLKLAKEVGMKEVKVSVSKKTN